MRETGHRSGESQCLQNLGIAAAAMGRHREALDRLTEAMNLHRTTDTPGEMLSTTLVSIALNFSLLGEHKKALTPATEGAKLAERLEARKKHAEALNVLGELATNRGDFKQATPLFRQAEQIARDIGDQPEQIQSAVNLGVNALRSGEPAFALQFFDQAQALLHEQDQNRWALLIAQSTGDAFLALSDASSAQEHYKRVLLSHEDSDTIARARAAYGMARLALAQNPPDHSTAREWLEEARSIQADAQLPALEQQIDTALAEVAVAIG
jgi:tetratricopeptide (TPR) repeat protein